MNRVKGYMLVLMTANLIVTVPLNNMSFFHMFYFFSYWGDIASFLATLLQIWACKDPKTYQAPAMIFQEMAWAFNLLIFPLFWLFIFPWELEQIDRNTTLG